MTNSLNPALHEEPRSQPVGVITSRQDESILDWLERTGRLVARDTNDLYQAADDELVDVIDSNDAYDFDDDAPMDDLDED